MTLVGTRTTVPRTGLSMVGAGGEVIDLPSERWHAPPDGLETTLLANVSDPALDVGCGPGRIVTALAAAGRPALGVDPSPAAIAEARRRRAPVLARSVFDPLPGEGRWATVLLLDGNIGIGGDPEALLARAAQLLRPGGQVVAEVEPPGAVTGPITVRLDADGAASPWFAWATVGADRFDDLARAAGLCALGFDVGSGRWLGRAVKP